MSKGIPQDGDRATKRMDYASLHATDIEDETYLYHRNPGDPTGGGMTAAEHTAIGNNAPHHAPVTMGSGNSSLLALSGQQLTLSLPIGNAGDVLTTVDSAWVAQSPAHVHQGSAIFFTPRPCKVGEGDYLIRNLSGRTLLIEKVQIYTREAPEGDDIIIDILSGSMIGMASIFADPGDCPSILDGENVGESTTIGTQEWASNDYLLPSVLQVGTDEAGGGVTIQIIYT
jgi:hypothetical protein